MYCPWIPLLRSNKGTWRAITSPTIRHVFYIGIILAEAVAAFLCWKGAIGLFKNRNDLSSFKAHKTPAIYGLTLGVLIWFVGFIAIGGEWFLMWQSTQWNGIEVASCIVTVCGVTLLYLLMPDGE